MLFIITSTNVNIYNELILNFTACCTTYIEACFTFVRAHKNDMDIEGDESFN